MFKTIIAIATITTSLIVGANAQAQTGGFGPEISTHTINDCMVYVDTWYIDEETGLPAQAEEGYLSEIYVSLMNDSWLYEVTATVSFHFHQNYTGPITFQIAYMAEHVSDPGTYLERSHTYTHQVSMTAEQERTVTLGTYFDISDVWDGTNGDFRDAIINVGVLESIPGFLRVDIVKVKKTQGAYCGVN